MKERFIMRFPPRTTSKPLTYELIKDYDIKINILKGIITAGKEGRLLVEWEAEEEQFNKALKLLEQEGVEVLPISDQITLDKDNCVHCGACTSTCFSKALDFNRQTWELEFVPEKCVACGLCAKSCPLRLFTLEFGDLK
jgi:ferredoxin